MPKHKAVIVGAGRIGAGFGEWRDPAYTHAGAYKALDHRVELVGFVEPDEERAKSAWMKWGVMVGKSLGDFDDFDIVSVCTHPEQQAGVMSSLPECVKGAWVEKPWVSGEWTRFPVQVNYQRRADLFHRTIALNPEPRRLTVYGKDDETTRCHFRDLSRFWNAKLDYRPFQGPCAYILSYSNGDANWFDNGGVDSAECFKGMLGNLLDAVEGKADLFSPPYVEA